MALVGYSDSEASDDEQPQQKPQPQTSSSSKPSHSAKPAPKLFSKEAGKIKVSLPGTSAGTREDEQNERPAKRARLGGGLGGFGAMLPAPKNPTKKPGPGRGVSLKTGAQATFSREAPEPEPQTEPVMETPPEPASAQETRTHAEPEPEAQQAPSSALPKPDFKDEQPAELKGKGNVFKFTPLSVARKKQKSKQLQSKASPLPTSSSAHSTTPTATAPIPNSIPTTAPAPPPAQKKKTSLFATAAPEESTALPAPLSDSYTPLLETQDDPQSAPQVQAHTQPPIQPVQQSTVSDLAATLNLSAAEKRQLFGRRGDAAAAAHVAQFNLANEYKANQAFAEAEGASVQHNPVRAMAPGKHSLQQLINHAQNQAGALEEHFARGKNNKKEAGNKYGW